MDRSPKPLRALLVQTIAAQESREQAERYAQEIERLTVSAGLQPVGTRFYALPKVNSGSYLGTGNLDNLAAAVIEQEAELVVFNHALTPIQQRNLEKGLACKVADRTGIILEIFAARAQTREGRLQVELAALLYQQSRLVRTWTHLERQKGGVGLRGGPGETQIEVDRRLIRGRIRQLEKKLTSVQRTRTLQRRARQDVPFFSAALVGYTNAGKSTLFNYLTGAQVLAEDQLFATLDPTVRRIRLPNRDTIILSDTVGFIRDLPHQLIAAFRATLEETLEADLLVHVVDVSDPEWEEQEAAVLETLHELHVADKPLLTLYNKTDLLPPDSRLLTRLQGRLRTLLISSVTGHGVDRLLATFGQEASKTARLVQLCIPVTEGALLARLCQEGRLIHRQDDDDHIHLTVQLSPIAHGRLLPVIQPYTAAACDHATTALTMT
ncbi:MAG: GTPase HflX [Magnetococcales bacterium]|nr:GTPase HflX [Magnetococcales bacterium]NGZ05837.1 GTPase HflX [Magnetococcales bacterium]